MLDLYSAAADELNGRIRVRVSTAEPSTAEMTAEVQLALQKITGQDAVLDTTSMKRSSEVWLPAWAARFTMRRFEPV